MALSFLHYPFRDGYIHNWLVAGPQRVPETRAWGCTGDKTHLQAWRAAYMEASGITEMPVERSALSQGTFRIPVSGSRDYEGTWAYTRAREDHFVDVSTIAPAGQVLRAWAYAQVELPSAAEITMTLTTYGPADVWVNDAHVCHHEGTGDHGDSEASNFGSLRQVVFRASCSEGRNAILIRFEQVAESGVATLATALQMAPGAQGEGNVEGLEDATVVIPTMIEPLERRNELEQTFEAAYMSQYVYERNDPIHVQFEEVQGQLSEKYTIRLQAPARTSSLERIYAVTEVRERPDNAEGVTLGPAFHYPDQAYHALMLPAFEEYGEDNMRITRELSLWGLGNNIYSETPYGELVERRFEALKHAARYSDDIWAEMAKMAVSWWSVVESPVILRTVARVQTRQRGSALDLLALLGLLIRFSDDPKFPAALKAPLEEAILGYRFSHDGVEYETESERLLVHTCEILAGERFPTHTFVDSGQTGDWHREEGQKLAMAWMRQRAAGGYTAWDSDVVFAETITALIHLAELADNDEIWEMATALLDKTLYSLALNSFKGSFGSTRGLTEAPQLFHGMLEATSGISRLMWGMGAFTGALPGYVSMACAETYGFPQLVQAIAMDVKIQGRGAVWSRERTAPEDDGQLTNGDGVVKVMYRTPDYMLSSVQDYRPGEKGEREHVWQATLGPAARVFVNHPACASLDAARRPNFWRGNGVLPRVAQWQDVLITIYALPEIGPTPGNFDFTHAYFPIHAFDAYAIREDTTGRPWAFAQKGAGYLALTVAASHPMVGNLALSETGLHAQRELRAYGQHAVWLCQMGREAQDGTFTEFQEAVLRLAPKFGALSVTTPTLRGEMLAFGWDNPLLRDGKLESGIAGADNVRHFESLYGVAELPAEELIIVYGEQALRLNLK